MWRRISPIVVLALLVVFITFLLPKGASAACYPTVSGDRSGLAGTTPLLGSDGSTATFFLSNYDNWQYIQVDFHCTGNLSAVRRYMTRDGVDASGHRPRQGEGFAHSVDGVNWIELTGNSTSGWGNYVNYRPEAWHTVDYGWSAWLRLNAPVQARFVRFNWDGDHDAVNELEIDFAEPPRLPLPLTQWQHFWPMLGHDAFRHGFTSIAGPEDATILEPWPFSAGGRIQSSPTIDSDGSAYFGADDGHLYAVRTTAPDRSGLERWRFPSRDPILGSPALKEDLEGSPVRVYFATQKGDVHSLDARDGSLVWSYKLPSSVRSSPALFMAPRGTLPRPIPALGPAATPPSGPAGGSQLLGAGLVGLYISADNGVYALWESGIASSPTVTLKWKYPMNRGKGRTSVALSPDSGQVYATDGRTALYFIDAATGNDICPNMPLTGTLTSPVVDPDGYVYVGSDNGPDSSYLYGILPYPAGSDGRCVERWALKVAGPVTLAPALAPHGLIVFVSGITLYAADRVNGSLNCSACWKFTASWVDGSQPIVDGSGILYLAGRDRKVHAISDGKQLWEALVDDAGEFTAPALDAMGRLYIGSADNRLYVLQDDPAFKIAFESDLSDRTRDPDIHTLREVYGSTDLRRTVRVTDHPTYDGQPSYSTDGNWLAFVSDRSGSKDIYLGTSGGLEVRNLTQPRPDLPFTAHSDESAPAFSPSAMNGQSRLPDRRHYLALTSELDTRRLYFIDLDLFQATGTVTTTNLADWLAIQGLTSSINTRGEQGQASFSPDGRQLAYSACTNNLSGHLRELVLVSFPRGLLYATVGVQSSGNCFSDPADFAPAFSPDSRYLVYQEYGELKVLDQQHLSRFKVSLPGLKAYHPSWSPDGTEIAFTGVDGSNRQALYVLQGPYFVTPTLLTGVLPSAAGATFDHADYHPVKMPKPRLSGTCSIDESNPLALQPPSQQPRSQVMVRGCGFDIRFPKRNRVYFTQARDRRQWVEGDIRDAWVDPASGLGVLDVTVPDLAGDGAVAVVTPFGQARVEGFHVVPLPLEIVQSRSVHGAKIRVLGYGFQITDATHARLNKVYFTGPNGSQTADGRIERTAFEPCGTPASNPITPCPTGAPLLGSSRYVEWLEVVVPDTAAPGPIRVTNDDIIEGDDCCHPRYGFRLLQPQVSLSRVDGCEGDPDQGIPPVSFQMSGQDFPYDPYFQYTTVDLRQIEPGVSPSEKLAGPIQLQPTGSFISVTVSVASSSHITNELHMQAIEPNLVTAQATHSFRTPMADLPIIFVPGTSATYLRNNGEAFDQGTCIWSGGWTNDYREGEDVWLDAHALRHIVRDDCESWLDVIKLEPTVDPSDNDQAVYLRIGVGPVMEEVQLPSGEEPPTAEVYKSLFNYITSTMHRPVGTPGAECSSGNCFYPFSLDWRKGYKGQSELLGVLVDQVLKDNHKSKVIIVTQSVGGPVTQYYLRTHPDAPSKVDQVITMGGGFMGVVLPYKILVMGDNWGLRTEKFGFEFELDPETTRELSKDWPTAYWQLPQADWFEYPEARCPEGDCTFIIEDGFDANENGVRSERMSEANTTYSFIRSVNDFRGIFEGEPINLGKFDWAYDHLLSLPAEIGGYGLGDWRHGTQGVFFHRIVGSGVPTVGRLRYSAVTLCEPFARLCYDVERVEPIETDGDGTIPLQSAVGILDHYDDRVWGLVGIKHLPMSQQPYVHDLIRQLAGGKVCSLNQEPVPQFGLVHGNPAPTSSTRPLTALSSADLNSETTDYESEPRSWRVDLSGRARLQIQDAQGRRSGHSDDAYSFATDKIPEVLFDTGPSYTHAFLPSTGVYTITLEGDDTTDLLNLSISPMVGMAISRSITFLSVPFSPHARAQLVWNTAAPPITPTLTMDLLGDGSVSQRPADAILEGRAASDKRRPTTAIQVSDGWLTIKADDVGGTGIHRVLYGTDRGQEAANIYKEPVKLPDGVTYVWAFAIDRAGNSQYPSTVYETCHLPTDFDGNGTVETKDIERVAFRWRSPHRHVFDLNDNSIVDVGDIQAVGTTLSDRCPTAEDGPAPSANVAPASSTIFTSMPDSVRIGDSFMVDVHLQDAHDLGGYEFDLVYNPRVLEMHEAKLGGLLGQGGRTSALLGPSPGPEQFNGLAAVSYGGYSYGDTSGADGKGVLMHVTFRAIDQGPGFFSIQNARLVDVEGNLYTAKAESKTLIVKPK